MKREGVNPCPRTTDQQPPRRQAWRTGDYTVEGMEGLIALERKSLEELVGTLMHSRERFFAECERLTEFRWRALLVEASYEEVKSP